MLDGIDKKPLKVIITYAGDKDPEWGAVYLVEGERLQDVMNDSRPFLPVLMLKENMRRGMPDEYHLVMLNKQCIFKIEERS